MLSMQGLICKQLKNQNQLPEKWNDLALDYKGITQKEIDEYLALCKKGKISYKSGWNNILTVQPGSYLAAKAKAGSALAYEDTPIVLNSSIWVSVGSSTSSAITFKYAWLKPNCNTAGLNAGILLMPSATVQKGYAYLGRVGVSYNEQFFNPYNGVKFPV